MTDPVRIGDNWFDRGKISAVVRSGGKVLIFLGAERPVVLDDHFSEEELEDLAQPTA